jgi:isocitrate lyase
MKTIEEKAEEICERLTCHEVVDDEREELETHWAEDPRWQGVRRPYSAEDVLKLRGNLTIEYTFAKIGAKRLWYLINHEDYVPALGALTGNQAVQQVEAGLKAIYLSGWQVAADANLAGEMYPDQSLYPIQQRTGGGPAHQQRPAACRPDSGAGRKKDRSLLVRPHRRRCRGRIRRPAQCV